MVQGFSIGNAGAHEGESDLAGPLVEEGCGPTGYFQKINSLCWEEPHGRVKGCLSWGGGVWGGAWWVLWAPELIESKYSQLKSILVGRYRTGTF